MTPPIPLTTARAQMPEGVSVIWCEPDEDCEEWHYYLMPDLECGVSVVVTDSEVSGIVVPASEARSIGDLWVPAEVVARLPWSGEE